MVDLKLNLFEGFATEEYLPWSETEHSAGHYHQQSVLLKAHLIPYFDKIHLHEITPKRIEDYKAMRAKKVNRASVNRELFLLKKLLRKATEWGLLDESPARDVKAFKETPKTPRLLEIEEVVRLLEECKQEPCQVDLYALACCMVYAGLRKAETLNMRWNWIDWKHEELTIRPLREWHTKNYKPRRLPLNDVLLEALRRVPRTLGCPLVFPTPEGTVYKNAHYIYAALKKAAERASIVDSVTFHQLRHTFCSHALMQGIDPRTVQLWMGHKDLRTTLRYAHTSAEHEKAAMKRLRYESSHYMDTGTGHA